MVVDLQHRSVVNVLSLTAGELQRLIALSADLKAAACAGTGHPWLSGQRIALVSRENELAAEPGVPIYGGLSGDPDAVRVLAGLLTMLEYSAKPLRDITYCYLGDGRSSLVDSLMIASARLGMNVRICAPYSMWPDASLTDMAHRLAVENGGRFLLTNDIDQGAYGVDFLYSGIRLPGRGEKPVWGERVELLSYCRGEMLRPGTGQAIGGGESCEEFGPDGIEIIDEIFTSGCSIMTDEASNCLHVIKAVMVATLTAQANHPLRGRTRPAGKG